MRFINWKYYLRKIVRESFLFFYRIGFKNKSVSVICNNCVGGVYCHDLRLRFNSPFVNLNIKQEDFVVLVANLERYIDLDIKEYECDCAYPVGIFDVKNSGLEPIKIEFIHYKSYNEAFEAWNRRKKRINFDNIRIILDITSRQDLEDKNFDFFNKIRYKKIILTGGDCGLNKFHINFKNKNFKIGRILDYYSFYRRFSDQFNYKKFLS